MNQRISRWLLLGCAILLGACSADTSVLGPTAVRVPSQTVAAPSRSLIVEPAPQTVEPAPQTKDAPAKWKRRGRYAMAAN